LRFGSRVSCRQQVTLQQFVPDIIRADAAVNEGYRLAWQAKLYRFAGLNRAPQTVRGALKAKAGDNHPGPIYFHYPILLSFAVHG
jgi:hypothetical protein